ncbi:oligopeptide/dipeptide ABC transporter ATP-binding protein [Lysinibacillus sp. CNPSo 3705]|uniref:oligopeptide/dipeptide ABC transporter ATP-binding protein n=1 Tax=Lysinibacillus sp. CNPSo 3705 TaxID=3028148 RepID=UPI00308255C8
MCHAVVESCIDSTSGICVSKKRAEWDLGKLVEETTTDEIFINPMHPYTKALLSAMPVPNPRIRREKIKLQGEIPSPLNPPTGCVFQTRCPFVMEKCRTVEPELVEHSPAHKTACHLYYM